MLLQYIYDLFNNIFYAYHMPGRSTMGSIFCVRQLIEKRKETWQ